MTTDIVDNPGQTTLVVPADDEDAVSGLSQEKSFIGDLISFTDRSQRLPLDHGLGDINKRRFSDTLSPIKQGRGSIRRSESVESKQSNKKHSLRRSGSEKDITSLANSDIRRQSPTKQRLSPLKLNAFDSEQEDTDGSVPRRRQSRRDSMMLFLRADLQKIPCLTSLQQRNPKHGGETTERYNSESDTETEEVFQSSRTRRMSRRRMSSYRSASVSSFGSLDITEAEMRKLRMLETLNKMGACPTHRKSLDHDAGELAILEASFGMGNRRGSIATRVLMVSKQRNKHRLLQEAIAKEKREKVPSVESPPLRTQSQIEREEMQESQKEKSKKIFDLLKKKAQAVSGDRKESVVKEDAARNVVQGFRRRFRRKRMRPLERWRRKAKFLILLLRAWKIHSNALNEVLVDNNESLDMMTRGQNHDLLFDITEYGATKEAKVSAVVKRILQTKPNTRSEDDKHYIQVFLRNYKSIAEYPVKMQKLIATRSWYESYDIKRVIVREGHVPMCFYFVLSGSAVVSAMDKTGVSRTVMFLNRGDSFGDVAILNNSRRETTVISREKLELLVMTDEDFTDIFMSGGLRDPNDPFLSSIPFLDGWPREMLLENPKKCIFSYFKRGTVLVADSSKNDWIFVVKSGSASVLKKLHSVDVKKPPRKRKQIRDFRDGVLSAVNHEHLLTHAEQLTLMQEEEMRGLDGVGLHARFYALPEINIQTNDSYNELKTMKEEFANANSINRALSQVVASGIDIRPDTSSTIPTVDMSSVKREKQRNRRKSVVNAVNALKGPFILKSLNRESSFASISTRKGDSRPGSENFRARRGSVMSSVIPETEVVGNDEKVSEWQDLELPSLADDSPLHDLRIKPPEMKPIFVEVQSLTKGQCFGLADALFGNNASLSLVSNGAECILVDKKFYQEFASQALIVKMRENTYPYPSDADLQDNLEAQMRWEVHKKSTLQNQLSDMKIRKSDKHDARAVLNIARVIASSETLRASTF